MIMKRAVLIFSDYLIMEFFKKGMNKERRIIHISKNGLPDDVTIIRMGYDNNGTLRLLLESEEFEDMGGGKKYPELPCPEITSEVPIDVTDDEREAIKAAIQTVDVICNYDGVVGQGFSPSDGKKVIDVLKSLVNRLERV